jgi:hypothetical protein
MEGRMSQANQGKPPPHSRRLSDKILLAFHHACDQSDFEVAKSLLDILEVLLARRPRMTLGDKRRRDMAALVAAHERLWHLQHGSAGDP